MRCFGDKISLNGRPSPISLISRQNNAKHYRHYFDCDSTQGVESGKKQNADSTKLSQQTIEVIAVEVLYL